MNLTKSLTYVDKYIDIVVVTFETYGKINIKHCIFSAEMLPRYQVKTREIGLIWKVTVFQWFGSDDVKPDDESGSNIWLTFYFFLILN